MERALNRWHQTRRLRATTGLVILMHLLAVAGIVHLALNFSWQTLTLGVVWYLFCGLSITAGYHRLFAHCSYKAAGWLRAFWLAFGAAAIQRSALKWCSDHRVHHRFCDQKIDPYSVTHGFWWAHMGWVISEETKRDVPTPRDLQNDRLVKFQDDHWMTLAILFGAVIPLGLGFLWGDPIGALLVAGFTRTVVAWHSTAAVNSFAHRFGRQTYSKSESARDSFWVALLTFGEGYHNFHHRFQADYRNGVRWWHFDPTKWTVFGFSLFGVTKDLKRMPREVILAAKSEAAANP
ncbi:MAG: fatty acid desaturase [Planctomycetes bacterium]|nr:fatty acid desaturase [Planctomycetota bacterium]